jgi:hypothetical protein
MNSIDCIIYCTGSLSINELRKKTVDFVGADKIEISFIEKGFYDLSVHINEAFDKSKQVNFPDGFLYFKFIIEVGFYRSVETNIYVDIVSKLLKWIWGMGVPAVASCDYENLLPENGGYNSNATPWIYS